MQAVETHRRLIAAASLLLLDFFLAAPPPSALSMFEVMVKSATPPWINLDFSSVSMAAAIEWADTNRRAQTLGVEDVKSVSG